ncbi:MAG: DNA primase [Clostridia bacterium]|nr:DNA primase [Clostridia bacterium]
MRITPEFIEELKFRNKIEDVVGGYVQLKRAGSNMSGLCPFHSEKTPSFIVTPSRSTFHCFGCGAGGDVITFVMQADNLDYISALEVLAKRVGMEMPNDGTNENTNGLKRSRIYQMNKEAAKFFNMQLKTDSAINARTYLEKRGMPSAAITHFGIGYAPDSFSALSNHMRALGYTQEELKDAFLCGKSNNSGKYFDYFRNRIIFPIIDVTGNVIAFGGRAIGDAMPKYLNSSDTPAFKKSRNLFALNFARLTDKDYMILCEGYMDVIAMHMAGYTNAVATLGTALTTEQARILARYTKKIVLSYDSDEAGINATKRAIPILEEVGLETKVLTVKGAKDPDEFIKKYGAEKFKELIEGSQSKLDFLINTIHRNYDMSQDEQKIKALKDIVDNISTIEKETERKIYINKISEEFGYDKNALSSDVEHSRRHRTRVEEKKQDQKLVAQTFGYGDTINRDRTNNIKASSTEEAIIGIMLMDNAITKKVLDGVVELKAEDFITDFNRRVFSEIVSGEGQNNIGMLAQKFTFQEISRIETMQNNREQLKDNGLLVFNELVESLKELSNKPDNDIDAIYELLKKKK